MLCTNLKIYQERSLVPQGCEELPKGWTPTATLGTTTKLALAGEGTVASVSIHRDREESPLASSAGLLTVMIEGVCDCLLVAATSPTYLVGEAGIAWRAFAGRIEDSVRYGDVWRVIVNPARMVAL